MRRLIVLAVTVLFMAGWIAAYRALSPLSASLVPLSGPGLRGLTLYLRGDYGGAARAYREAGRGRVRHEYVDDTSGAWALYHGDLATAEARARTTLTLVPTTLEPLVTLGEVALGGGDPRRAMASLGAVLDRQADHVAALLLSAVAHGRLGDSDRAIRAINRALRHGDTGTPGTLFHVMEIAGDLARQPRPPLCLLAQYHRYLRIFDERHGAIALAYAERALATGDNPADAWLTIGIVHDKRGEHGRALQAFQQAIAADPRHAEAHRWAAVQAHHLRDPLLEYRMARAALESAPDDLFYLAPVERVVMRSFGDSHTMTALLDRILERNPTSAAAHEAQARAVAALGDHERAAEHSRQAADLRRRKAP
ncbi:MAG: tetratricopeptide repeat protein [Candidatus Rokuibacteriota bacterium]